MNRRFFILLLMITLFVERIDAQELSISGYYENQFFPQELSGRLILQDYNKIRLDLSVDAGENVSFNGDYIYRVFHGKTQFNAFDFIPRHLVLQYAARLHAPVDSLRPGFSFAFEDQNFLDNAYATIYLKHFNLRIGKQQLPWGTGYTWNPTDIFNNKNTLDPTYEKVGVNAFKLEVPFGREGMVTGILGIGETWKASTKALKAGYHVQGFDLSISFVEKIQEGFDYTLAAPLSEKRRLIGSDFSGECFGLGIWGEGAYNVMGVSGNFGQYLAGADYTFENGLYLTGEYYHNGPGKTHKSRYTLNDWMRLLGADGENLGRDYLFTGGRYPVTELWNGAGYALINLSDKSGVLFPWFDYTLNDNTEVMFVGYIPFGAGATEFGEFGIGGFARVRVYF